jgi:hypothetical protein
MAIAILRQFSPGELDQLFVPNERFVSAQTVLPDKRLRGVDRRVAIAVLV